LNALYTMNLVKSPIIDLRRVALVCVSFGFADGPVGTALLIVGWYLLAFAPALLTGLIITAVSLALADDTAPEGPRVAVAASLVLFAIGLAFLSRVDPTRREAD
jgi:uncharacterized membrane protein YoaK (UPF0700 family)